MGRKENYCETRYLWWVGGFWLKLYGNCVVIKLFMPNLHCRNHGGHNRWVIHLFKVHFFGIFWPIQQLVFIENSDEIRTFFCQKNERFLIWFVSLNTIRNGIYRCDWHEVSNIWMSWNILIHCAIRLNSISFDLLVMSWNFWKRYFTKFRSVDRETLGCIFSKIVRILKIHFAF